MHLPFANVFVSLVRHIAHNVRQGRELTYSENAIGITSLLTCPIKSQLSKQYGNIDPDFTSVEIEDGYLWEQQVKTALKEIFGDKVIDEYVLKYEFDGIKIEGHLDVVIQTNDYIIGLELKAPKYLSLKEIPKPDDIVNYTLLTNGNKYVYMPPTYVLQSRIQNYLLRQMHPDKPVYTFIFAKSLLIRYGYARKFYVVYDTNRPSMDDQEFSQVVEQWRKSNKPTFALECFMCQFFDYGICEGATYEPNNITENELDNETKQLINQYLQTKAELKRLETQLKKHLKGSVTLADGTRIGWHKYKRRTYDINKLIEKLKNDKTLINKYLTVRPSMVSRVTKQFPDIVIDEEESVSWQG